MRELLQRLPVVLEQIRWGGEVLAGEHRLEHERIRRRLAEVVVVVDRVDLADLRLLSDLPRRPGDVLELVARIEIVEAGVLLVLLSTPLLGRLLLPLLHVLRSLLRAPPEEAHPGLIVPAVHPDVSG